jgi:nicotinate-nucleotide pyrophosphorylase (carboxylating)
VQLPDDIGTLVARCLAEDIGAGDITAALISPQTRTRAQLRVREEAVLCGCAWFDEAFRQLDASVSIAWHRHDGDLLTANSIIADLGGPARALLTGERTALNLLQTLSGTASQTRHYVAAIAGTGARILDTRKTLPGLRLAQKYAVLCGGGTNHRIGLFDAYLIKENHIAAAGSIRQAVAAAHAAQPGAPIEVEIETLDQMPEAIQAGAHRLLLDNFDLSGMRAAVVLRDAQPRRVELEASGGIELATIRAVAETGVDFISTGAITKHLRATDFSLRME